MCWWAIVCIIIFTTHVLSLYEWFYTTTCRNNHVCGNVGSEKLFRKDCTRVQFPIWLRGSVHISIHVLRRVAARISSSLCIKFKRHSFGQFQFSHVYKSLVLVIA